jgi:diacylglycerol kinase (ATP)
MKSMSSKHKPLSVKLITNPNSGKALEAPSLVEQAVRCLSDHGIKVDVAFGSPQEESTIIAQRAVEEGYKTIIAMGGDGTIGAVIRGIAGADITLGIIASGTMNDIATSLGIPEDVEEACALIAKGDTRKLDLGVIKTSGNKKFYFFMVTAIGLTAALFPDLEKAVKGRPSKLIDAIETLTHYKPNPKITLTFDKDSKINVKTMLVTVTNTPLIASKNLVAPDASMQDGLFDISVFPDFSKTHVMSYFARTADEHLIPDGKLQRFRASTVKIKSEDNLEIAADGISLGKGTAVIKMRHGALRVFAPVVGSGAEKSNEQKLSELDAPLSPFVEKTDPKAKKKLQQKKQQDRKIIKRNKE